MVIAGFGCFFNRLRKKAGDLLFQYNRFMLIVFGREMME
jgi:hypothetical protein